jgi:hypothetical protein
MEFIALIYLAVVFVLLKGVTKKQKMWIGGTFIFLVVTFIIGTLFIRYKTGFFHLDRFEWINSGASVILGKWAVPSYLIFAFAFLLLTLFRLIQRILAASPKRKWLLLVFTIVFTIVYIAFVYISLLFVGVLFFPFAP